MRELSFNEMDKVYGGPGPLIYIAGAVIGAVGAAVGGYLAGRSSSNSATSPLGTVNCPDGTAPSITQTEISCKPIAN